jgi:Asp-tRNA(Asn)/Glu-tRNA(Gln) amidotransferase A subunit family amidase
MAAVTQSDEALREAAATREQFRREYAALFAGGLDAIASPGREGISDTMQQLATNSGRRGSCTRMYNMTGLPALVLPMGFGAHGMPLGLQIAANRLAEDRVYQIAAAYEGATDWHRQRPAALPA